MNPFAKLTDTLIVRAEGAGYVVNLLLRTFVVVPHLPRRWRFLLDNAFNAGVRALPVTMIVAAFAGAILAMQTGIELRRFGDTAVLGTITALSMCREMGPFITATILAATVGSSIAAEIGTMAVSEELAALEVLSIDRVKLLVLPRLVALALMCPLLTVVCDAIGIVGGGLVAQSQLHVGSQLYFDSAFEALRDLGQTIALPKDVFAGLTKSFVFGLIIASIACSQGLQAKGGALGVGHATRGAVRDSIIAVIVSNYFMTWFMYRG